MQLAACFLLMFSTLEQLKEAELSGKEYVNSIQQQGSAVPFTGP